MVTQMQAAKLVLSLWDHHAKYFHWMIHYIYRESARLGDLSHFLIKKVGRYFVEKWVALDDDDHFL
jgi:hypothetical protein